MRIRRPLVVCSLALAVGVGAALVTTSSATAAPSARDAALATALGVKRVSRVKFDALPLKGVVQWLRVATGFNFHVKTAALQKANVDVDALTFTVELEDVTVRTLIEALFEPQGIYTKVDGNVIWLTTKAEAAGKPVTRIYGISHITWTKVDFIAPEINLRPSDFTPAEEYVPEQAVEGDPLTTGDGVVELIKEQVSPGEWDTEGWSIRATDRYVIVRAPLSVQREVMKALDVIAALK
jgi:hypothetical protein